MKRRFIPVFLFASALPAVSARRPQKASDTYKDDLLPMSCTGKLPGFKISNVSFLPAVRPPCGLDNPPLLSWTGCHEGDLLNGKRKRTYYIATPGRNAMLIEKILDKNGWKQVKELSLDVGMVWFGFVGKYFSRKAHTFRSTNGITHTLRGLEQLAAAIIGRIPTNSRGSAHRTSFPQSNGKWVLATAMHELAEKKNITKSLLPLPLSLRIDSFDECKLFMNHLRKRSSRFILKGTWAGKNGFLVFPVSSTSEAVRTVKDRYREYRTKFPQEYQLSSTWSDSLSFCQHPPPARHWVVQEYVEPALLRGHKFDLRVYVCVTGTYPITAHICGWFARMAWLPYKPYALNISVRGAHISNIIRPEDAVITEEEHIWASKMVEDELVQSGHFSSRSDFKERFLGAIVDAIAMSLEALALHIDRVPNVGYFLGFDILVKENFKMKIAEFNNAPQLRVQAEPGLSWLLGKISHEHISGDSQFSPVPIWNETANLQNADCLRVGLQIPPVKVSCPRGFDLPTRTNVVKAASRLTSCLSTSDKRRIGSNLLDSIIINGMQIGNCSIDDWSAGKSRCDCSKRRLLLICLRSI